MATSVLGACVCYDLDGNPAMHSFGGHNDSCMIPVTITSSNETISSVFNVPAFYGQPNAPFTAADATNTIVSLCTQVETKAATNAALIATPPVAWYAVD